METSVNNQEFAEPEMDTVNTFTEVEETEVTETDSTATETEQTEVQSVEDNAKYAAARRRAEQEFAERQRLEDLEYERRFKDYENPITHQPIRSRKDYFEALDAQERLKMEQQIANGNVNANDLNAYIEKQINNSPAILQAQQIIEQQRQTQIANNVNECVKEIQRIDPSVKSIDDILNADNAQQIINYVRTNNVSLTEAYKMANFERLMSHQTASAKQATINNLKGTQHLNSTTGISGGDDGVDIPQSELGQWRRAYPDLSLKELRKKYNKVLGS